MPTFHLGNIQNQEDIPNQLEVGLTNVLVSILHFAQRKKVAGSDLLCSSLVSPSISGKSSGVTLESPTPED